MSNFKCPWYNVQSEVVKWKFSAVLEIFILNILFRTPGLYKPSCVECTVWVVICFSWETRETVMEVYFLFHAVYGYIFLTVCTSENVCVCLFVLSTNQYKPTHYKFLTNGSIEFKRQLVIEKTFLNVFLFLFLSFFLFNHWFQSWFECVCSIMLNQQLKVIICNLFK